MLSLKPETELASVPGFGPRSLSKLEKLNIRTVRDLFFHFPVRYEDWSETSSIAELKAGDEKTITAKVMETNMTRSWRKRMFIVESLLSDETGSIRAVWFNQPYIKNTLKPGISVNLSGKTSLKDGKIYLSNPVYEIADDDEPKHTGRLVPVYPETKGLTSKGIRFFISSAFEKSEKFPEFLPKEILETSGFPEINLALKKIHYPERLAEAELARERFSFEELLLLQIKNKIEKLKLSRERAEPIDFDLENLEKITGKLPFTLTDSQKKALIEIMRDLEKSHPMNRLLQGDVGSGKTIVVGIASIISSSKFQVALMAPTEILARQHYRTFTKFFPEFRGGIGLLVSGETRIFMGDGLEEKVDKRQFIKGVEAGRIKIVIGTQAVIQKGVNFKNLGLTVVDEQHRFGVGQRAHLLRESLIKDKIHPHLLSMSATPIPRTLMLSLFGDLDLSIISELPKGRKSIVTKVVDPLNRDKAYAFVRGQVRKGRQVFVICPRIEPVEGMGTAYRDIQMLEVKAVKDEHEKLSKNVFPDLKVALLHGKMKTVEKEKVMSDFAEGRSDILVSTSVVEVGVDVPNANIMIIEGAEKFGLAQLYQLRGRVGRGEHQSFCLLFTDSSSTSVKERLETLATAKNGFELAEKDLKFRGPGEFFGESQTGLPDVAMQALQKPELVIKAREAAEKILRADPTLKTYPELKKRLQEFRTKIHLE